VGAEKGEHGQNFGAGRWGRPADRMPGLSLVAGGKGSKNGDTRSPGPPSTMNNPQLLIDAVVQQTMVFIAQLATAGGVRAPLAGVAQQVFADLTAELERQGVTKKVIADMFGMALRTYHRKSQELRQSQTEVGRSLWEAVYAHLGERTRASAADILHRFRADDAEVVTGILNDLVASGLVYRTGRGALATYKLADQDDFDSLDESRAEANRYLVWFTVYRNGPLDLARASELARVKPDACDLALRELVQSGRMTAAEQEGRTVFRCDTFDVPLGSTQGWEAAVLDHFQAMTGAILRKLARGPTPAGQQELIGGSTWSLDVWPGHPLENRAKGTLSRVRQELEALRREIDDTNRECSPPEAIERVVVYVGQNVQSEF